MYVDEDSEAASRSTGKRTTIIDSVSLREIDAHATCTLSLAELASHLPWLRWKYLQKLLVFSSMYYMPDTIQVAFLICKNPVK